MDWQHYNVHFKSADLDSKVTITALSKEDAKHTFEQYAARDADAPGSRKDIPFEAVVTKVIGPLGLHQRTPKQHLATQYRSCIGSAAMVAKALSSISIMSTPDDKLAPVAKAHSLAVAQAAKLQRDIRDLFRKAGLNIK